MFQQSIE